MSKPGAYLKLDGNGAWWCDPQDYSGLGLKSQIPTPKSAQLASRAPARAALQLTMATGYKRPFAFVRRHY